MNDVMSDGERLARAVLMFYSGNDWRPERQKIWYELTGKREATTTVLGDLARKIVDAREREGD